MKAYLYIALFLGIFTYMFWQFMPKGTFYVGNALFIFLLASYIFSLNNRSFIKFLIFGLSFGNLMDELYFDPTKLGANELALVLVLPIIWFFKFRKK